MRFYSFVHWRATQTAAEGRVKMTANACIKMTIQSIADLNAFLTTCATVSRVIPFRLQYCESIQVSNAFAPLLALQEQQHRAMFS